MVLALKDQAGHFEVTTEELHIATLVQPSETTTLLAKGHTTENIPLLLLTPPSASLPRAGFERRSKHLTQKQTPLSPKKPCNQ